MCMKGRNEGRRVVGVVRIAYDVVIQSCFVDWLSSWHLYSVSVSWVLLMTLMLTLAQYVTQT